MVKNRLVRDVLAHLQSKNSEIKMAEDKKLEDKIVMYHGSLDELNSRNPDDQYEFAEKLSMVLAGYPLDNEDWTKWMQMQIKGKGYDGIVNRRTIITIENLTEYARVEGTPIIRVKKGGVVILPAPKE
jgi:hypothetical protein